MGTEERSTLLICKHYWTWFWATSLHTNYFSV